MSGESPDKHAGDMPYQGADTSISRIGPPNGDTVMRGESPECVCTQETQSKVLCEMPLETEVIPKAPHYPLLSQALCQARGFGLLVHSRPLKRKIIIVFIWLGIHRRY